MYGEDARQVIFTLESHPVFARQMTGEIEFAPMIGVLVLRGAGQETRALINLEETDRVSKIGCAWRACFKSGASLKVNNVKSFEVCNG